MLFRDLPGFTRFKSDPTKKYDGLVPFDAPLDAFQIGHDIFWEFPIDIMVAWARGSALGLVSGSAFAAAVGQDIVAGDGTGIFEYKILEPGTEQVQLWQRVTLKIGFTAIVIAGFLGSMDFFSWAEKKVTIDTFTINSAPTDKHPTTPDSDNPAWRYTLGNSPLAEFGFLVPGGGTGVGVNGGEVISFFQGPFYLNVNIAPSAGLDIVRDQWLARIARRPLWSMRGFAGDTDIDAFFEHFGSLVKLYERAGRVYASLAPLPGRDEEIGFVGIGRDPSGTENDAGRFYCGVQTSAGVIEYVSNDSGITWARVQRLADDGTLETYFVWGEGYTMARFIILEDGNRGTITYKNGAVWWKTSRDHYAGAVLVGAVTKQVPYELAVDERGLYWASSIDRGEFYSDNGGETWTLYEPAEAEMG